MKRNGLIRLVAFVMASGWASAHGHYVPPELLALPVCAVVGCGMGVARCAMEENPPADSIRARMNLGIWEREGLAATRVLSSPLNVITAPCGMNYVNLTKRNRALFDKVATTPAVLIVSILYGACGTADEILVGAFEMLTTMKVKQVYYPWETDRVSCDDMTKILTAEPKKSH